MKPPCESIERSHQAATPAWIIFPKYQADAAPSLTPLSRAQAFMQVADNAFNYSTLGAAGFAALAQAMDNVRCYEFEYSALDDAIATFAALEPLQQLEQTA